MTTICSLGLTSQYIVQTAAKRRKDILYQETAPGMSTIALFYDITAQEHFRKLAVDNQDTQIDSTRGFVEHKSTNFQNAAIPQHAVLAQ